MAHWDALKDVVAEDLFVFGELDPTRHSMGYTQNIFTPRVQAGDVPRDHEPCRAWAQPMERWNDFPAGGGQ